MDLSIKEIRVYLTTLSQAKFAKTFHIPLSTFSHWEQEERTPPQYVNWMLKNIVINDFYSPSGIAFTHSNFLLFAF